MFEIGKNRDDTLACTLNWRDPVQSIPATKNIKRTWMKYEFARARIAALQKSADARVVWIVFVTQAGTVLEFTTLLRSL